MSCFNTDNFELSTNGIKQPVQAGEILSMEIELSLKCNFRCPYCYVPDTRYFEDELSVHEIKNAILQAKKMGAKKIILLGGEPSIYPHIMDIITFVCENRLEVEMFTNGSGITREFASFLFENKVRVVLKKNTLDKTVQDKLTGIKGTYEIINAALTTLENAGYGSDGGFLALSTVICSENIDELPLFWQWIRDRDLVPYFEIITPQANAKINTWLDVSKPRLKELFEEISRIDREKYNSHWEPQPPLMGNRCMRHQFSCLITSKGDVMPCVGVTIPLGNIREDSLFRIIKNSTVLKDLKNYKNTIKGPCGTCEKSDCYGCRGAAYQVTGDYLASDPTCWRIA